MKQTFNSIKEVLAFDFTKLEPNKSNYLIVVPKNGKLRKVNDKYKPERWRIISNRTKVPQIEFEINPRWLTITMSSEKETRREDFPIFRKDVVSLIRDIFSKSKRRKSQAWNKLGFPFQQKLQLKIVYILLYNYSNNRAEKSF